MHGSEARPPSGEVPLKQGTRKQASQEEVPLDCRGEGRPAATGTGLLYSNFPTELKSNERRKPQKTWDMLRELRVSAYSARTDHLGLVEWWYTPSKYCPTWSWPCEPASDTRTLCEARDPAALCNDCGVVCAASSA